MYDGYVVSTHSRPKAAGRILLLFRLLITVSTHSRPKAAGGWHQLIGGVGLCFNTQPPEGGWFFYFWRF